MTLYTTATKQTLILKWSNKKHSLLYDISGSFFT